MIALGNSANGDVQIGLVSWCARRLFVLQSVNVSSASTDNDVTFDSLQRGFQPIVGVPGVFQKVSAGYRWIRGIVCSNSLDSPESFHCLTTAPSMIPSDIPSMVPSTSPSQIPIRYPTVLPALLSP